MPSIYEFQGANSKGHGKTCGSPITQEKENKTWYLMSLVGESMAYLQYPATLKGYPDFFPLCPRKAMGIADSGPDVRTEL